MATKICLLIISFIGSIVVASSQELGKQRDFDLYDKPILSTFFEEAFYPRPRQELVSTENMYDRKKVKQEIDMVYEMQRKEAYRKQQSKKHQGSVERFREKFNVQRSSPGASNKFRTQTSIRPVNPIHDPYMMDHRSGMRHPLYRSSFMRPGLYNTYGYGTQIETNLNKKEEKKEN